MKKIKIILFILLTFLLGSFSVLAEDVEEVIIEETPTPPLVNFIIRINDSVIWQDSIPLPDEGTVLIKDSSDVEHEVNSQSVLSLLHLIDEASEDFLISDLQYFDSFGAFYLHCILPTTGEEACDNWQYAVGNSTPFDSIDATILSGEETVGIYFGSPFRIVLGDTTIISGGSVTATTEAYNYEDNTWFPRTGVSVGLTLPNPEDPWNPTIVSTHPVNELGSVTITITEPNTYDFGIVEDFFFPSYPIIVSEAPNNGGGGGASSSSNTFSVPNAISYLKSVQESNGSFGGADLYTDWVAIAFGAANVSGSEKDMLLEYMKNNSKISSLLTDNERRAMAILSLKQNPYSFGGLNYIKAILEEFDGTQFGDDSIVNDDIFAIIPLYRSGFDENDEIILKTISHITSKQKGNGSWEDSVDLTAASIQALKPFETITGVSESLTLASGYLQGNQSPDGGFDSIYSTSWALQAMNALGEFWVKDSTPEDYIANHQEIDGAALPDTDSVKNRIWATSYAIPAMLNKPWYEILKSVSKQEIKVEEDSSSNDSSKELVITEENIATSTPVLEIPIVTTIQTENAENNNQIVLQQKGELPSIKKQIVPTTTPKINLQAAVAETNQENFPVFPLAITAGAILLSLYFFRNFFAK